MDQTTHQSASARNVSLNQLFMGFLVIGLLGFGGLAMSAYHVIVEKRRWLDKKEFSELFAICSILPGGNIMNCTIMIGARYQGAMGSVVSMGGAASAAAGLIVATATKLGLGVVWRAAPIAFALTTFVAVSFFRLPLWLVILVIGSSSILMASRAGRRS